MKGKCRVWDSIQRYDLIGDYDLSIGPLPDGEYLLYEDAIAEIDADLESMAAALDYIIRRLKMNVDDGSRPDQWTMEDMIRIAKDAIPSWWVIGKDMEHEEMR